MNDQRIAIITDSGTNTPEDFAAAHDVRIIPLRITFKDGTTYETGIDITADELVGRLDDEVPTTSLPSPARIRSAFEEVMADGYVHAIFVGISSGLSGTLEAVRLVAESMAVLPVTVVDTKSIGVAAGLVVMEVVRLVEAGVNLHALTEVVERVVEETKVFFTVRSLDLLRRGGRIGEPIYRIGSLLNIKPILTCDDKGTYAIARKARGWRRALESEVRLIAQKARTFPRVRVAISSHDESAIDVLEHALKEHVDNVIEVVRSKVTPDLLVHTGPTLVGMAVQAVR